MKAYTYSEARENFFFRNGLKRKLMGQWRFDGVTAQYFCLSPLPGRSVVTLDGPRCKTQDQYG